MYFISPIFHPSASSAEGVKVIKKGSSSALIENSISSFVSVQFLCMLRTSGCACFQISAGQIISNSFGKKEMN